jgi:hypothetical protein
MGGGAEWGSPDLVDRELSKGQFLLTEELLIGLRAEIVKC